MDKELRESFVYPPAGSKHCDMMSGWLSVIIRDDCSIDVYVEPEQAMPWIRINIKTGETLSTFTEEQTQALYHGKEFIFRARCKSRAEAERTARSIVDFITKPGLICMDLEDIRSIAAVGDHEARLWLFERFDDEPIEEFKERIKNELPPLTSLSLLLHVEGDIGMMEVFDLEQLFGDLLSEEENIWTSAQYVETPGYKALFVFAFEE